MLKNRLAVIILTIAISSSLVACKSNTDEKENTEPTQTSSVNIQGDVLNTGGNFNKLLVSNNTNTADKNTSGSSELKNEGESGTIDDIEDTEQTDKNSRPPVGLAVKDSEDKVDIEENKVIGTIDYDILDISKFEDCPSTKGADAVDGFTNSTQSILSKFYGHSEIVAGYLKEICDRYYIDTNTVESNRGLKVDKSLTYEIVVAHNTKYNIYLAINKEDYTAKFSVKEK